MPLYSYTCDKCAIKFDLKATLAQKETGEPEIFKCPACGSPAITRQLTNVGILNRAGNSGPAPGCPSGTCPFVN